MEHYVYILFRETGIPFYVGMGKGRRWLDHERPASLAKGKTYKDAVCKKVLARRAEIPKVKVAEGLSEKDAFEIEKQFIAAIGRHPVGPLSNMTDGGDGGRMIPEVCARIAASLRGRKPSDAARARMSAAKKGKKFTDDHRANMAEAKRAHNLSQETLARRSAALTGQKRTLEQRARMRAGRLRYLSQQQGV